MLPVCLSQFFVLDRSLQCHAHHLLRFPGSSALVPPPATALDFHSFTLHSARVCSPFLPLHFLLICVHSAMSAACRCSTAWPGRRSNPGGWWSHSAWSSASSFTLGQVTPAHWWGVDYPSVHPSIQLSINPSIYASFINPSINPSIHPSNYQSIHHPSIIYASNIRVSSINQSIIHLSSIHLCIIQLSINKSFLHPSLYLAIHLFIYPSILLSSHPSICLFIHLYIDPYIHLFIINLSSSSHHSSSHPCIHLCIISPSIRPSIIPSPIRPFITLHPSVAASCFLQALGAAGVSPSSHWVNAGWHSGPVHHSDTLT